MALSVDLNNGSEFVRLLDNLNRFEDPRKRFSLMAKLLPNLKEKMALIPASQDERAKMGPALLKSQQAFQDLDERLHPPGFSLKHYLPFNASVPVSVNNGVFKTDLVKIGCRMLFALSTPSLVAASTRLAIRKGAEALGFYFSSAHPSVHPAILVGLGAAAAILEGVQSRIEARQKEADQNVQAFLDASTPSFALLRRLASNPAAAKELVRIYGEEPGNPSQKKKINFLFWQYADFVHPEILRDYFQFDSSDKFEIILLLLNVNISHVKKLLDLNILSKNDLTPENRSELWLRYGSENRFKPMLQRLGCSEKDAIAATVPRQD